MTNRFNFIFIIYIYLNIIYINIAYLLFLFLNFQSNNDYKIEYLIFK